MRAPPASCASSIADSAEANSSTGSTRPTSCERPTLIDTSTASPSTSTGSDESRAGASRSRTRRAGRRRRAALRTRCRRRAPRRRSCGIDARDATGDRAPHVRRPLRCPRSPVMRVDVVDAEHDQPGLVRLDVGERVVELSRVGIVANGSPTNCSCSCGSAACCAARACCSTSARSAASARSRAAASLKVVHHGRVARLRFRGERRPTASTTSPGSRALPSASTAATRIVCTPLGWIAARMISGSDADGDVDDRRRPAQCGPGALVAGGDRHRDRGTHGAVAGAGDDAPVVEVRAERDARASRRRPGTSPARSASVGDLIQPRAAAHGLLVECLNVHRSCRLLRHLRTVYYRKS